MPDPLKFAIDVAADTKGAQDTKAAIQEVAQAAQETNQAGEAAAKQGEQATQQHIGAHKKLREALRGLAIEFPELAHIAHLALNPISLAIGALVLFVGKLRDAFKQLDEVLQTPDFARLTGAVEANKEAMRQAAIDGLGFERELKNIATAQQTVTQKTDTAIEAIRRQSRAQTELTDAQEALALAQVDAAEKEGTIGGVDAIQKRLAVQKQFADQKRALQQKELEDTLAARQKEAETLPTNFNLQLDLIKKRAAAEKAGSEAAVAAKLDADKKNIESTLATLDKLKATMDELKAGAFGLTPTPQNLLLLASTKTQIESQEAILQQAKQLYEQDQKRSVQKIAAIKAAQDDVKLAEDLLKTTTARRVELEQQLELLKAQNAEAKKLADQLGPLQENTRQAQAAPGIAQAQREGATKAGEIVGQARGEAPEALTGQLSAAARQIAADKTGQLATKEIVDAVVSGLTFIRNTNAQENQQLAAELRKQVADLREQIRNRPYGTP